MPAVARERTAVCTFFKLSQRIASPIPGISLSATSRVISGTMSVGRTPVPPTVNTTSTPASVSDFSRSRMSEASSGTISYDSRTAGIDSTSSLKGFFPLSSSRPSAILLLTTRIETLITSVSRRPGGGRSGRRAGGNLRRRLPLPEELGSDDAHFIKDVHRGRHDGLIKRIGRRRQDGGDREGPYQCPLPVFPQHHRIHPAQASQQRDRQGQFKHD